MVVTSGAIITNSEGKYLLQLRDAKAPTYPNEWGLFGGHAEGNETPLETLIRELREELDILFSPKRFAVIFAAQVLEDGIMSSYYSLQITDEECAHISLNEGAAYGFFSKEEMAELAILPVHRMLLRGLIEKAEAPLSAATQTA